MTITHATLFDRIFARQRSVWVIFIASLLFLLLPFAAAYLDGVLDDILHQGFWRVLLLPQAIIIYIFLVSPVMSHTGDDVIRSIQPFTSLDEESFIKVINPAAYVRPLHEILAFSLGCALGVVSAQVSGFSQQVPLLRIYWFVASILMDGILFWTIFIALVSTRVNSAMLRLPLNIDLSNQAPLEAVGRQSLLLAMVFVGGITISILFSMRKESLLSLEVWASYLVLILVTVLIFFLSMYPTHRVLAQVKKKELELVRKQIQKTFHEILRRVEENQPIDELPTQINTLTLYEQRIQASRSWPYNTAQLRTLFVSVIVPLVTFLARRIGEMISPQ